MWREVLLTSNLSCTAVLCMFRSPFHPVIINVGVHARVIKRQRLNTTMHDEYERITGEVVHNLPTHTHIFHCQALWPRGMQSIFLSLTPACRLNPNLCVEKMFSSGRKSSFNWGVKTLTCLRSKYIQPCQSYRIKPHTDPGFFPPFISTLTVMCNIVLTGVMAWLLLL